MSKGNQPQILKDGHDPVILGDNQIYSGNCEKTQLNLNRLIVGSSGAGKSLSFMEPELLYLKNSSAVLTVSKRALVEKYMPWFLKMGYWIQDLNLANPEKSDVAYDPLRLARSPSDIKHLAMAVVMADPQKAKSNADPYWDKGAASLMTALICMVKESKPFPTFADVLDLLNSMEIEEQRGVIVTNLDSKFETLRRKDPNSMAVSNWRTFKQLPIKTASCIFSALQATVDDMFTPELKTMMRKRACISFKELATRHTVLFVTTSAVNTALHRFVNMFNAQMLKELFEFAEAQPDGCLPVPVRMLFDDFAVGSKILGFPDQISIFRAKKMSVMLLLQSESQLASMYGENDATTIINNCDTYVYLGGMDLRTCRNVSQRLNVPLEDVLYMPIGQEFIFRRGQRPVITQRYRTLEDPNYIRCTEMYQDHLRQVRDCA